VPDFLTDDNGSSSGLVCDIDLEGKLDEEDEIKSVSKSGALLLLEGIFSLNGDCEIFTLEGLTCGEVEIKALLPFTETIVDGSLSS
jgi:hypothetical protein